MKFRINHDLELQQAGEPGFDSRHGKTFSPLYSVQNGPGANRGLNGRRMKLTNHFQLVPRSRMVEYTSTLPHVFMVWYLIY
jgi:hypothetical protein